MKKKKYIITALALTLVIGSTALYATADAANVQIQDDQIKVFIGSTTGLNPFSSLKSRTAQQQTLQSFAAELPNETSSALISFDGFLTEQELAAALGSDVTIKTVYIWAPGQTGRSIIDLNGLSPAEAVAQHFADLDIENWLADDPSTLAIYRHVQDNYGYFAAEVIANNQVLQSLTDNAHVSQVDLMYNETAETRAASSNMEISYICIPDKPDGTQ